MKITYTQGDQSRVIRLRTLIDKAGIEKVSQSMGISPEHINRNLLTGKSQINLVKLVRAERHHG